MSKAKVLVFSGSSRKESFNKRLAWICADCMGSLGAATTKLDLADYELPLYNGDLEEASGLPENVMKLKSVFQDHNGLMIACPEYNSSITPLLKNTIDWISRPAPDEQPLQAFSGKVAGLVAASPGALGGLRGLVHVRSILQNIGVMVLPKQVAVGQAHEKIGADSLNDDRLQSALEQMCQSLVASIEKLNS